MCNTIYIWQFVYLEFKNFLTHCFFFYNKANSILSSKIERSFAVKLFASADIGCTLLTANTNCPE